MYTRSLKVLKKYTSLFAFQVFTNLLKSLGMYGRSLKILDIHKVFEINKRRTSFVLFISESTPGLREIFEYLHI